MMAQSAKLQLRQSQGLALTPQLMQSIKLLQMNSADLHQYILGEVEKNPLLELDESRKEFPEERRQQTDQTHQSTGHNDGKPAELAGSLNHQPISETTKPVAGSIASGADNSQSAADIEAYIPHQQSLRDVLLQQAALTFRSSVSLNIAKDIIDLIDGDGYLRNSLEEICAIRKAPMETVCGVLERVQKFDPPGVGARDLSECMQLQLTEKNRLDPAMRIFTQNLQLLAQRNFQKLADLCDVDHEDVIDMAMEIQALDPRPGEQYTFAPVQNISADVIVRKNDDGSWHIELNSQNLPKVLINREYYAEIKELDLGKSDKKFMVDNLQGANWLVASLDQRARTILKVATEIVTQQDNFFSKGEEHLKPLTLKNIADRIKMHESTVSRVTNNKYLVCDQGIFELKYFFMSGIGNSRDDQSVGSQSIRLKIKNLIELESVSNVLSDEKLADLLNSDGIGIARRTVTKYRESLGLLSSIQRRREKKAFATRNS